MIQPLIEAAVARLRVELAKPLDPPDRHVVSGPLPEPTTGLPVIALSAGKMEAPRPTKEAGAGEPRPQPTQQRVPLESGRRVPYPLDHSPLPGTASARLVLDEGTLAERRELLMEGKDFTIDYRAATLTVTTDVTGRLRDQAQRVTAQIYGRAGRSFNLDSPQELSTVLFEELKLPAQGVPTNSGYHSTARPVLEALAPEHPIVSFVLLYRGGNGNGASKATMLLDYSFAGIYTTREFEQDLLIDVYAANASDAARLSSLAAGVLLTYHDELLASARTDYLSGGSVSTSHQLTRLELVSGTPSSFEGGARVQLAFRAAGQILCTREAGGRFGIIKRIASPASVASGPVAVDVEIG